MPSITSTPSQIAVQSKVASDSTKPATPAPKTEVPQVVKDLHKDNLKLSRGVSPLITIPGSAVVSGLVGAATGGIITSSVELFGKGGAVKEAFGAGALIGGAAGVVSGTVVAHMAKNKTQATLYSALAGFGTGAVIGGAKIKTLPAALAMGAFGAISGAVSGFTTAKLLGK
ncbi:MAG: hypothetical protein CVV27_14660 [Candidatus Melainabacteria bacterium HGW-Melainabacteria-1]|nr:MAG: hypothetical protein CVV27_14660 [Candidatus Melainabacteria bacterium HGW-Melainabacteria-1]